MTHPEINFPPHIILLSDEYWQNIAGEYPGSVHAGAQSDEDFSREHAAQAAQTVGNKFDQLGLRPSRLPIPAGEVIPMAFAERSLVRLDVDRRHTAPDGTSRHFYGSDILSFQDFDARIQDMSDEPVYSGPRARVNGVLPDGRHATVERDVWYGVSWGSKGALAAVRGADMLDRSEEVDWASRVRLFSGALVVGERYAVPQLAESVRAHEELTVVAATLLLKREVRDPVGERVLTRVPPVVDAFHIPAPRPRS